MKRNFLRSRVSPSSGFTLVELLVVIGIIAILASVLMVSAGSAINAAKRAKAANTINQIQAAALNYYTEYSVYPVPSNTGSVDYTISDSQSAQWGALIIALSGNLNPYNPGVVVGNNSISNTRAIPFINLKKGDVNTDGAPLNPLPPDPVTRLFFNIAIDSDYDGVLGVGSSAVQLPDLTSSTIGNIKMNGGSSTAGVALWGDCNGNLTRKNPAFWVKTY